MYSKIEPEWTPAPSDIAWLEGILKMLMNNGVWACPCSETIFVFNKEKKEYKLLAGDHQDPANCKTFRILKDLGWRETS